MYGMKIKGRKVKKDFCTNVGLGITYLKIIVHEWNENKRTSGPVNAHLRSAVYTNVIENSPSIEAGEALGPLFFQNNQYTIHTSFSLQMTF